MPVYFFVFLLFYFFCSQENAYGMQLSQVLVQSSRKLSSVYKQKCFYTRQQLGTEKTKEFVFPQSAIPLREIVENPVGAYKEFKHRLKTDGPLAGFPEFQETVEYLLKEMHAPDVMDLVKNNQALWSMHNVTKLKLLHLNLIFENKEISYPHTPPFTHPYPYFPSICTIKDALEFFDTVERVTKKNIPPLYHSDRYLYYFHPVLLSQERDGFVLIPTHHNLSISDFIKVRSTPIGFVGVSVQSVFADGYYNSPLDFLIHDVNHVRRLKTYNDLYALKHKCGSKRFSIFDQLVKTVILPSIEINDFQTREEQRLRKMLAILWFELLHEYAFTPDRDSLTQAFKHHSGAPSPFEHMIKSGFDPKDLEVLRMPNNNLESGFMREKEVKEQTIIRYFFDKGPNFLTSAYNKVKNSFYDNKFERNLEYLPALEERTPLLVAKAAQRLWAILEDKEPVPDLFWLLEIIQSKTSLEKYPNDILVRPMNNNQLLKEEVALRS